MVYYGIYTIYSIINSIWPGCMPVYGIHIHTYIHTHTHI